MRSAPLAIALMMLGAAVVAQQPPTTRPPTFHSNVNLTTVTATVVDKSGALVTGLPREAFQVFEDGDPQEITQFTNERVPVSLALLVDVSDSMYGQRIRDAREAIEHFVADLLELGDEYAIVAFNHRQQVLTSWTTDAAVATPLMEPLKPFGSTAIYDAIVASLPLGESRTRQRLAVLVISDGADTASDHSLAQARETLRRSDAFVYAIAIDSAADKRVSTKVNPEALREITGPSGGYTEVVRTYEDLGPATQRIAEELNSQYTLGYAAVRPQDGSWRSIRVRVKNRDYIARSRRGYFAAVPRT